MSSPVLHGFTGVGLAYVLAGNARLPLIASLRKAAPLLVAGAVLACLPDVDYLPGLTRGALNTAHQQITHSLTWIGLVAIGLWTMGRAWKPDRFGWRAALFLVVMLGSHLAIDLITKDQLAIYGIPLGAPFSWQGVRGPVSWLPVWKKMSLMDLADASNLSAFGIELGVGSLFAIGCVALKRGWTRRKASV